MRPVPIGLGKLVLAAMLSACAALEAPVDFDGPHQEADADETHALSIQLVEGRPEGLVLRFAATDDLPEDGFLEVWRSANGGRAAPLRRAQLQGSLRERLAEDGFDFLDRAVQPAREFTYQIRVRRDDGGEPGTVVAVSDTRRIRWHRPPAPPTEVTAASFLPGIVELSWKSRRGDGILIFRRDVLDPQARPTRLEKVGAGARQRFVDRDVEPGGVYAYRVATAAEGDDIVQFGRPSDEVYVTVAAAPGAPSPAPNDAQPGR